MNTSSLFIMGILAHVTAITTAALVLIRIPRRSTLRHAIGVIGMLLVVGSPLSVLLLPRPGWIPLEGPEPVVSQSSEAVTKPLQPSTPPKETGDRLSATIPELSHVATFPSSPAADFQAGPPLTAGPSDRTVPIPFDGRQAPPALDGVVGAPDVVRPKEEQLSTAIATSPVDSSIGSQRDNSPDRVSIRSILSTGLVVLGVIWICGIVLFVWRDWRRRRELGMVCNLSARSSWDGIQPVAAEVCSTLKLKALPEIRVSESTPLPFVTGLLNPVVILPSEVLQSLSADRLRDVLIHECAHIVRRDAWVHLMQRITSILFWLHPGVHWLNRQIARAREEVCDNFVIGRGNAADYAETLLTLAESCGHKRMAPSTLGLISPRWTLERRIGGLLDPARDKRTRTGRTTYLILLALFSSFNLMIGGVRFAAPTILAPAVLANSDAPEPVVTTKRKMTVRGAFVDEAGQPLADIQIQILNQKASTDFWLTYGDNITPVIAEAKSDAMGHFVMADVDCPTVFTNPEDDSMPIFTARRDGQIADVRSLFNSEFQDVVTLQGPMTLEFKEPLTLSNQPQTLSGTVTDANGKPVAGASVSLLPQGGPCPVPGLWTAVTDRDGRYSIRDLAAWKRPPAQTTNNPDGTSYSTSEVSRRIVVAHPDHLITTGETTEVPNQVDIKLPPASYISGTVIDATTGQPAAAVVVRAKGIGLEVGYQTRTEKNGHYRLLVQRDHYRVWVVDENRVADVLKYFDATAESPTLTADFKLTSGALIRGIVVDESTNQPLAHSTDSPTFVAHYGPAYVKLHPGFYLSNGYGAHHSTAMNPDGTFRLRVAPGQNTIFVSKYDGDVKHGRQTVSVVAGEEKKIEFRVSFVKREPPEVDANGIAIGRVMPAEVDEDPEPVVTDPALEATGLAKYNIKAEQVAAAANGGKVPDFVPGRIPSRKRKDSAVNRLLDAYERSTLHGTLGATDSDRPSRTIKEIVDLGPAALPDLLEELDVTQDSWMVQMLGFTLRALNDRRVVPALIRAIPKSVSIMAPEQITDYDKLVYRPRPVFSFANCRDPKLNEFCLQNDAAETNWEDRPDSSSHTPCDEILGALRRLTGAKNGEEELLDYDMVWMANAEQMQVRAGRVTQNWTNWWQQHQHDKFDNPEIPANEAELIAELKSMGAKLSRDGSLPGRPVGGVQFDDGKGLSEHAMGLVKQFKQLSSLQLSDSSRRAFEFNGFDSLEQMTNLRRFWISSDVVTDQGLASIGKLRQLTRLSLNGEIKSDGSGLKALSQLTQLRKLDLAYSGATNELMFEIGKIESIMFLRLEDADIDDRGLASIGQLKNLNKLELVRTKITDAGLRHLNALHDLDFLDLRGTKITSEGLKELRHLRSLSALDLTFTPNTGRGLEELATLKNLTSLRLSGTPVNDEGLKSISKLMSLQTLNLADTRITDEGLKLLKEMKNLTYLDVKETDVTSAGVQELKNALPKTHIAD